MRYQYVIAGVEDLDDLVGAQVGKFKELPPLAAQEAFVTRLVNDRNKPKEPSNSVCCILLV